MTDRELDAFLAINVMGWRLQDDMWYGVEFSGYSHEVPAWPVEGWSPTELVDQAVAVLGELRGQHVEIVRYESGLWRCFISYGASSVTSHQEPTMARAICTAIALWWELSRR